MARPPLETLHLRNTGAYLEDRDPLLSHAMAAHGRDWRPDLTARLVLPRDDARGLPGVDLSTLEHRLEWPEGTGCAVFQQIWNSRKGAWGAEFLMAPLPDTLAAALDGASLSRVIDAPGADAWNISRVEIDNPLQTRLVLKRVATTGTSP